MSKRWSKLQKKIYAMVDPAINLRIHCVKYRIPGHCGMQEFPRYFVTLDGQIIFDWPKAYSQGDCSRPAQANIHLQAFWCASDISNAISKYLNAGSETQMTITDPWGISEILRAADRRIGQHRWDRVFALSNSAGRLVLLARRAAKTHNEKMSKCNLARRR